MARPDSPPSSVPALPIVPAWAQPRGMVASEAEAAFMAGAALKALDEVVQAAPLWAGAWRQRLALTSAAAAVSLAGRVEDEAALRDAWHLRAPGNAPGPAGQILAAWRRLASRSPGLDGDGLRMVTAHLGLPCSEDLAGLPDRLASLARSSLPAPLAAAAIVAEVQALRPDAGLLGWWLADQALALRLRWPLAVPLLVAQVPGPAFRAAGGRGRVRPGEEGFERAVFLAVAMAAAAACRLAGTLAPAAARLAAVTPKLRAKGAGEVISRLLDDDAVPGTLATPALSRWAARRLFERLTLLGAVRELSGRPAFRLYGL